MREPAFTVSNTDQAIVLVLTLVTHDVSGLKLALMWGERSQVSSFVAQPKPDVHRDYGHGQLRAEAATTQPQIQLFYIRSGIHLLSVMILRALRAPPGQAKSLAEQSDKRFCHVWNSFPFQKWPWSLNLHSFAAEIERNETLIRLSFCRYESDWRWWKYIVSKQTQGCLPKRRHRVPDWSYYSFHKNNPGREYFPIVSS